MASSFLDATCVSAQIVAITRTVLLCALLAALAAPTRLAAAADQSGAKLYQERCARCHEGNVERAPTAAALRQLSSDRILSVLTNGSMKSEVEGLTQPQVGDISAFLGSAAAIGAVPPSVSANARCANEEARFGGPSDGPSWNGWGADLTQRRFQPASMAQLAASDVPRLKLKWAFGFPDINRATGALTLVGGRVFVGSANGKVYSLDAKTGCIHWEFDAGSPVRTAISLGEGPVGTLAFFGDRRANAYAVDASSGKLLWKRRIDDHPAAIITGAPVLDHGVLYVPVSSAEELIGANPKYSCCTFRGSLSAVDAMNGRVLWKSYTIAESAKPVGQNAIGTELWGPAGAAIWSSPTVDHDRQMIYVTTGNNYSEPATETSDAFLAFHMQTGQVAWSRQITAGDAYNLSCNSPARDNCPAGEAPDHDFGSPAIMARLPNGSHALIAGQKSGMVYALDLDQQRAILWQTRVGKGGLLGGVQWGMAVDDKQVYVAVSDVVTRVVPDGTPGSQRTSFGVSLRMDGAAGGGLTALKLGTGELAWHTPNPGCGDTPGCSPAQSAAITTIPGVVFSGGLDGHLRAYASDNGRIIWDVDTRRDYGTVNGVTARGGSLDGSGPIVAGGMVYVESGYTNLATVPGNVLLAFSVDGQ
jgi:polyvinyl alcohol dehydrogenase (cytochrome)